MGCDSSAPDKISKVIAECKKDRAGLIKKQEEVVKACEGFIQRFMVDNEYRSKREKFKALDKACRVNVRINIISSWDDYYRILIKQTIEHEEGWLQHYKSSLKKEKNLLDYYKNTISMPEYFREKGWDYGNLYGCYIGHPWPLMRKGEGCHNCDGVRLIDKSIVEESK